MQFFFQDQNAFREIISSSEDHLSFPQAFVRTIVLCTGVMKILIFYVHFFEPTYDNALVILKKLK